MKSNAGDPALIPSKVNCLISLRQLFSGIIVNWSIWFVTPASSVPISGSKRRKSFNSGSTVQKIPYVFTSFLNARGNALIILTKSSNEVIEHWSASKAIAEYYRRRLKRRSGVRAFGITEASALFLRSDRLYFQPEAEVFPYQPAPNEKMLNITNIGTALKKKHA